MGASQNFHPNFTAVCLRQIVNPALDYVTTDLIRKYLRKVNEREGKELEQAVKVFKSHLRTLPLPSNYLMRTQLELSRFLMKIQLKLLDRSANFLTMLRYQ